MRKVTILMAILAVLCCVGTVSAQRVVGWPLGGAITDVTIQSAVTALPAGGVIDVDPSYNPGAAFESFPVCIASGGPLLIQGRFYPGTPTVIPGNGSDKIFCVMTSDVTIYGLDFTGAGWADGNCGTPAGFAGAIYISPGGKKATVDNCLFFLNTILGVNDYGSCIYVDTTTTVTITQSGFYQNQAGRVGGAICVNASSDVTIGFNQISENIAHILDGGGIAWWLSEGLIQDNNIWWNRAPYGGGLSIVGCNTPSTIVDHNTITSNTAYGVLPCINGGMGGGIYIENSNQMVQVLNHNEVSSNTADYYGGGIAIAAWIGVPCSPQILDNEIRYNQVRYWCSSGVPYNGGGGIAVYEDADYPAHALIRGNLIQENEAGIGLGMNVLGGGIGVFYGAAQIEDNVIVGNKVENWGGGIAAEESYWHPWMGPQLTIQDNLIQDNVARTYGGGVEIDTCGTVVLDRNNIDQNTVTYPPNSYGGGLDTWDTFTTARSNSITRNWTASGFGTAVYLDWGGVPGNLDFYNNTVADNDFGAGWYAIGLGDTADLENNIIANHPNLTAVEERWGDQTVTCINNLFWNNGAFYYDGGYAATINLAQLNGIGGNSGNFTGNPQLDGTYHLSSNVSAAYDAGVDLTGVGVTDDIDQESRPLGAAFEVGSDELPPAPGVRDWVLY